jgi:DivIVA domain-containing protein
VLSLLVFVVGVLVVGGLLFLGASVLLGRGETQPPAELDRSPVELPDDRPVTGEDLRALRMSVAVRGYRMTEVDWLVDQLATALDERDRDLERLRAELARRPADAAGAPLGAGDEPTDPQGRAVTGPAADGDPGRDAGRDADADRERSAGA